MSLHLVTGPTELPLSLHELKAHLKIEDTDNDEDALIMQYQRGVVGAIDGMAGWLGRAIMRQTWDVKFDRFPTPIRVPLPPLVSVSSISYIDENGSTQTLSSSLYTVSDQGFSEARIVPAYGEYWPTVRYHVDAVTVRFVAGWTSQTVPAEIRDAIMIMVAHRFANREPVNIGNIVSAMPMSANDLLRPWRVHRWCP